MAITLTQAAAERVNDFLQNRGKGIGLRLGVKTTGCSGMAYVLEFVDELNPEDEVFENHGVKVFVDPMSLRHLEGAEVDYKEDLMGGGFAIKNPNAQSTCGCGHSFTPGEGEGEGAPAGEGGAKH